MLMVTNKDVGFYITAMEAFHMKESSKMDFLTAKEKLLIKKKMHWKLLGLKELINKEFKIDVCSYKINKKIKLII
jgi:hypothetical protein